MKSPLAASVDRLRTDPVATGRTLPHLDGIRGMAVLFILIRHAWGLSGQSAAVVHLPGYGSISLAPFIDMMSSGIDLFFVLSAYLLAQQFIRADFQGNPRPDLRRYFRTRFLRIAPPYWVVLILTLILFTPTLIAPSLVYSSHGFITIILHGLFLQTAWFGSYGIWNIASPFWTLTIEVLFYAVLPWVVPLYYRNRPWLIGLPAGLAVSLLWLALVRWHLGPVAHWVVLHSQRPGSPQASAQYWLSQQIPASAFDFAMGMAMANLVVRRQLDLARTPLATAATSERAGTIYAAVGMLLAAFSMWRLGVPALAHQFYFGGAVATPTTPGRLYYFLNQLPFAIAYGLLIAGVTLGHRVLRRLFGASPLALFGVLGYSIYLIHMQFLYLFNTFPSIYFSSTPRAHFFKLLFGAGTATVIVAVGLYLAVERPFIFRSRQARQASPDPPGHLDQPISDLAPSPTPIAAVTKDVGDSIQTHR